MLSRDRVLISLSRLFFLAAGIFICLGVAMIVIGYPAPEWLPRFLGRKSIRKIFQFIFVLGAAALLIHPKRRERCDRLFSALTALSQNGRGIWVLIGIYGLLFLWNQVSSYLSININFLPFSFYDYMLQYLGQGYVNYTGLLHGFYHANNILYILYPLWYLVKTPLLLVMIHGPLLALGALPLFLLTRRIFPHSWIPLAVSFFYLNSRYLLNLLEMDFLVEDFYPILIFLAVYCLVSGRRTIFFAIVFSILLIKEDAALYMAALGAFLLFVPDRRTYGIGAVTLACGYAFFLSQIFMSMTHNDMLYGSLENFQATGAGPAQVLHYHLTHPFIYFDHLFGTPEKIRTMTKLLVSTFFLPLFSPWILLVLAALLPLFARGDTHFVDLNFHYAAVVLSFLFVAFVMGIRNLDRFLAKVPAREHIWRTIFCLLLVASGGNYLSHGWRFFQTETIRDVRNIPQDAILVTQGPLLPYAGYRKFNFYMAGPFEKPEHPYHGIYDNADYYFAARSANAYPYTREWLEKKIQTLKSDPRLELIKDDGERVLLKRRGEPYPIPSGMDPIDLDIKTTLRTAKR